MLNIKPLSEKRYRRRSTMMTTSAGVLSVERISKLVLNGQLNPCVKVFKRKRDLETNKGERWIWKS